MSFEDRCYVVFGTGFKPLKIRGKSNKDSLVESLGKKGFKPKFTLVNSDSPTGKKCKTTATLY